MNQRVYHYYVTDRSQRKLRRAWKNAPDFSGLTPAEGMLARFEGVCRNEQPHVHPQEKIVLLRTLTSIPEIPADGDTLQEIDALLSNPEQLLAKGFMEIRKTATRAQKRVIDAILVLTDAYKQEAVRIERDDVARVLVQIPRYEAKNLAQALQFLRIVAYARALFGLSETNFFYLPTLLQPYVKGENLSPADVEDLVCDFLIALKKDEDLVPHEVRFDPIEETDETLLARICQNAFREMK